MSKVSAALSKAGWNQHKLYAKTVWIFKWGHLTSFNLPALNLLNQLASFLPHCSCCPFTLLCFLALSTSRLYYILPLSSPFSTIKYFSSLLRHLQPWSFARFSYTLDFFFNSFLPFRAKQQYYFLLLLLTMNVVIPSVWWHQLFFPPFIFYFYSISRVYTSHFLSQLSSLYKSLYFSSS